MNEKREVELGCATMFVAWLFMLSLLVPIASMLDRIATALEAILNHMTP